MNVGETYQMYHEMCFRIPNRISSVAVGAVDAVVLVIGVAVVLAVVVVVVVVV